MIHAHAMAIARFKAEANEVVDRMADNSGQRHITADVAHTPAAGSAGHYEPVPREAARPGISSELLDMVLAHRSSGSSTTKQPARSSSGSLLGVLAGRNGASAAAKRGAGGDAAVSSELAALFGDESASLPASDVDAEPASRPWLARPLLPPPVSYGLGAIRPPPAAEARKPNLAPAPAPRSFAQPPPGAAAASSAAPAPAPPPAGPAEKQAQAQAVLDSARAACVAAHGGERGAEAYADLRRALKTLVAALAGGAGAATPIEISMALRAFIASAVAAFSLATPAAHQALPVASSDATASLHALGRFVHPAHRRAYRDAVVAHGFAEPAANAAVKRARPSESEG